MQFTGGKDFKVITTDWARKEEEEECYRKEGKMDLVWEKRIGFIKPRP